MIVANFITSIANGIGDAISNILEPFINSLISGMIMTIVGAVMNLITNMQALMNYVTTSIISGFCSMSGEAWTGAWDFAKNINEGVAVVGFGLFLTYWLAGIVDKATRDTLEGNELIRSGLELIVGLILITNSFTIMKSCSKITDWAIEVVSDAFSTEDDTGDDTTYWETTCTLIGGDVGDYFNTSGCFNDDGFMTSMPSIDSTNIEELRPAKAVGYLAATLMPLMSYLVTVLVSVAITVLIGAMALSRSIQIIVYCAFAPLAFADTFRDGFINSKAWRYIQKFLALNLQAGIILGCALLAPVVGAALGNQLAGDIPYLTMIFSIMTTLIAQLTALALAMKSNQIANDIVGV